MKYLILLATFFTAVIANAGTVHCSSADSSLTYLFDATDGGAPRDPIVKLMYRGKVLLHRAPFGSPQVNDAHFELSKTPVWQSAPLKNANYETIKSLRNISVTIRESGTKVFDDLIFCQARRYIGPPRP